MRQYAEWSSGIVARFSGSEGKTILDAGTGEITTFSYFLEAFNNTHIVNCSLLF